MKKIIKCLALLVICGLAAITLSSCGSETKTIKFNARSENGNYYDRIDEVCAEDRYEWVGYDYQDGVGFVPVEKENYYFSKNGKKQRHEWYRYDSQRKKWIGQFKSESTYNVESRTTTETIYNWDSEKDKWVKAS